MIETFSSSQYDVTVLLEQTAVLRIQVRASSKTKGLEARALRARKTLTPRFTDFFTDLEEKTDCFAVYVREALSLFNMTRTQSAILQAI